jgi:hypothetical protein
LSGRGRAHIDDRASAESSHNFVPGSI